MVIPSYHGNSGRCMNMSCIRGLHLLHVVYTPKNPSTHLKIPEAESGGGGGEEFKASLVYSLVYLRPCLKSN